jgi:hypothetical protein
MLHIAECSPLDVSCRALLSPPRLKEQQKVNITRLAGV